MCKIMCKNYRKVKVWNFKNHEAVKVMYLYLKKKCVRIAFNIFRVKVVEIIFKNSNFASCYRGKELLLFVNLLSDDI